MDNLISVEETAKRLGGSANGRFMLGSAKEDCSALRSAGGS